MYVSDDGTSSFPPHTGGERAGADFGDPADDIDELMASNSVAACLIEVVKDGDQTDYLFHRVSPAFESETGLGAVLGRSMRELRPKHEQYWFDLFARVARTGQAESFEHAARASDRRFQGFAFR